MTTKHQIPPNQSKDQIKQIILETVQKNNPETAHQLVQLVQEKTNVRPEEIMQLLIQLENQGKLRFNRKETPPTTLQDYVYSKRARWFWATITLALVTTLTVVAIPESAYPYVYVRSVLGTVFVLFLPGYMFMKALFPSKISIPTSSENMDTVKRAILGVALSVFFVMMDGLVLNYLPWGITLVPITLSLLVMTIALAIVAVFREYTAKP